MHFEMPVEIDANNRVTFTTPDGKSSTVQYPADWSEDQIMQDFKLKLLAVPTVQNVSVRSANS